MAEGFITRRGGTSAPAPAPAEDWTRPADWLAMPTVTEAEQKFVGLHAVWPGADVLNVCAMLFRGAYTVDWGDGTVEDFADNVKAEHLYDYSTIPSSTESVRGYRQVIVTVTPQGAGNLTLINFQQRYTGETTAYATGWLDVVGSFPNAGTGASMVFGGVLTVRHMNVERVLWLTIGGCTNCAQLFQNCSSLKSLPPFDTSGVTSMSSMLRECYALQSVPLFNTSLVTTMPFMFQNCSGIRSVPLFDTSSVTSMASMFSGCASLQSVPLFDTSSATNLSSMFSNCTSLVSIPALTTPLITTSSGTDFGAAFASSCASLRRCQMVFARTVTLAPTGLDRTALVEIFTNLVDRSATTSATITITNSKGAAALTSGERAIATGKKWTITG